MRLIAETAWHHDGDFVFLKNLVETISRMTSTDFIKFHITLDADEYMHNDHPAYEWVKDRILSKEHWQEIFEIVLRSDKKLMLLFNDKKAVDFGMEYNPELIEIHSVCLNDVKLLKHVRSKINKETKVVLGVGGSELDEIENSIQLIDSDNIVLMHGFQNFPTKLEDINLAKIKKLMLKYPQYEHGYADHTAWDSKNNILISIAGSSLGIDYLEKHVTTAYGEERVDWQAAISIDMFNKIYYKLEVLKAAYGDGDLALNEGEKAYSTFGINKKAAILNRNVEKGDTLKESVFDFKRSGQQTELSQTDILNLVGKKFSRNLEKGHCIQKTDIEK